MSACIVGKIQCQYSGNVSTNGQDVFDDYYDDFQVDPLTKQKLVEEERLSKIYSMKY